MKNFNKEQSARLAKRKFLTKQQQQKQENEKSKRRKPTLTRQLKSMGYQWTRNETQWMF